MEGINQNIVPDSIGEAKEAINNRQENITGAQRAWLEAYNSKGSATERALGGFSFVNASERL